MLGAMSSSVESKVVVSAIDVKLKDVPKSDVVDTRVVIDMLLDLRAEVKRALEN